MDIEVKDLDPAEKKLRRDMAHTRSKLTEKLETLEEKVASTVEGVTDTVATVTDAVQETVETVKDSVADTVETVKDLFDLPGQTRRRPWLLFGGSVAAGFLLGRIFGGGGDGAPAVMNRSPPGAEPGEPPGAEAALSPGRQLERDAMPQASWLGSLTEQLAPEIAKLRGLALGTLFGVIRDSVERFLPESLRPQVAGVIDSITTKLGGEPVHDGARGGTPRQEGMDATHAGGQSMEGA